MKKKKVLKKIANNKISIDDAYSKLYQKKYRKGHFIRVRIKTKESRAINFIINLFTILPVPISFIKMFIKDEWIKDTGFSKKEIVRLISHKGSKINVKASSGEVVKVKII